jgi:hypothetical protein
MVDSIFPNWDCSGGPHNRFGLTEKNFRQLRSMETGDEKILLAKRNRLYMDRELPFTSEAMIVCPDDTWRRDTQ